MANVPAQTLASLVLGLLALAAGALTCGAASSQEAGGPQPASELYLAQLQRDVDSQAQIIYFGDGERYLVTYHMRYQEASQVFKLLDPFKDPGGKLVEVPYASQLMIISSEGPLRLMLEMLDIFDSPAPQVQIEAKIVEITHSDDFQWGINIFTDRGGGRDSVTGQTSPIVATDAADTLFRGVRGTFDPDAFLSSLNPGGSPYRGGEIAFSNVNVDDLGDLGRIDVIIRALQDTGRGEVLSQPSILATVGKKATINVGEQVPVPNVKEQPNGTFTEIVFKDVGIKLDVTPLIIGEENITLQIQPEVSFVIEFILLGTGGVASPRISTRNVDATVSVRDGEAIVIGGLVQTQHATDEVKFPVLGDVPLVGNLFKTYRRRSEKTEVFFFLEPHIVTRQFRRPAVFTPDANR